MGYIGGRCARGKGRPEEGAGCRVGGVSRFARIWGQNLTLNISKTVTPNPVYHDIILTSVCNCQGNRMANVSKRYKAVYIQEFVRPRWPYDMRPSARAEKYIRDAGP